MKCLFWPLLDIINSLVTLFMMNISVLAVITETTTLTVFGGVFGLMAAVCYIASEALFHWKLLFNPSGPYQESAVNDKKVIVILYSFLLDSKY